MDSSSEADRVVQPVVSPSLLKGFLDAKLSDWLPQSQLDLGVEGFDTPPFTPTLDHLTPKERDELLFLASQQFEFEFPDLDGTQPLMDFSPLQDDELGINYLFLVSVDETGVPNQRPMF